MPLVYFDNAATMQMPLEVMKRMQQFYTTENGNIHRGIHTLSEVSTNAYEDVRGIVCKFLGTEKPQEIIFTSGTTAAINMVGRILELELKEYDEILITDMEHHSNYIVWQEIARANNIELKVVPVHKNGTLDIDEFYRMINEHTKIVAFTQLSNVTGIRNPVEDIIAYIRNHSKAYVLIDGAQGIVHCNSDINKMGADFYCFSGHKLGAPTGTGVLYAREESLASLHPTLYGGGIIQNITSEGVVYLGSPMKYEPGTPNYAGIIGLGATLQYWMKYNRQYFLEWEKELLKVLELGLSNIEGIQIMGKGNEHVGCLAVIFEDIHPYDVCKYLDSYGIAARGGHLCAIPYLKSMGYENGIRFSVAPYNTLEEIQYIVEKCKSIIEIVRKERESGSRRNRARYSK